MPRTFVLLLSLGLLTAAAPPAPSATDAGHYLDRFVDQGVSPRADFFRYAVGKWLKENPIPASERSCGVGNVVQEET